MKIRKIAAALCALVMVMSFAACGNSGSSSSDDKSAKTEAADETTKKSKKTEAKAEKENERENERENGREIERENERENEREYGLEAPEEMTEAAPEPEEDLSGLYAYYSFVNNKYNPIYNFNTVTYTRGFAIDRDKVFYSRYKYEDNKHINELFCYNISTKQTSTLMKFESDYDYLYMMYDKSGEYYGYDNCFYDYRQTNYENGTYYFTIEKISPEGKVLGKYDYTYHSGDDDAMEIYAAYDKKFSLSDGSTVWTISGNDSSNYVMFSSDLKKRTFLPKTYEYPAEHGLTDTANIYSIYGAYLVDGRLYVTSDNYGDLADKLLYLDESRNIFVKCTADDLPKHEYIIWFNEGFYDLSTGEKAIELDRRFSGTVAYDYSNPKTASDIILYDGKWYDVKVPGDGTSVDFSQEKAMGSEKHYITSDGSYGVYPLDDTYYIVMDEYGIFLRTYAKGEAEEETILLFDK